jgi:hypothetical protein
VHGIEYITFKNGHDILKNVYIFIETIIVPLGLKNYHRCGAQGRKKYGSGSVTGSNLSYGLQSAHSKCLTF